jgi:hypothetical protein
VVDFYLDDQREKERAHILQLIGKRDSASEELLQGYVREAMRESTSILFCCITLTLLRSQPSGIFVLLWSRRRSVSTGCVHSSPACGVRPQLMQRSRKVTASPRFQSNVVIAYGQALPTRT